MVLAKFNRVSITINHVFTLFLYIQNSHKEDLRSTSPRRFLGASPALLPTSERYYSRKFSTRNIHKP